MISEQAYALCMAIEGLPASEKQTQLSVMAAELRAKVAEVEAENYEMREWRKAYAAGLEQVKDRAEAAEARALWLEATITAMTNAHAHDDMALTAAYLNGAHAGKKDAEAFKARVMEWASERCICGLVGKACPKGMFDGETKWATFGPCPNWTPPQAWGGEHG